MFFSPFFLQLLMVFQFASRLPRRPNLILDLYCFSFSTAAHYIQQLWDIGLVLFLSVTQFSNPPFLPLAFLQWFMPCNILTNFTHVFVSLEILHSHDDIPILICNLFLFFLPSSHIFHSKLNVGCIFSDWERNHLF